MRSDFVSWVSVRRVLIIGLFLRLGWALLCPNEPTSDQYIYHLHAGRMAQGLGYTDEFGVPQNFWPVGYVALLAPAYAFVGAGLWAAVLTNTLCWLLGIAGMYKLTEALFDERAARLSALVVAVHPTLVMHVTMWASETPFCAATPWILWLCVRTAREQGLALKSTLLLGVLVGLLVYVRPPALLFLGCLFAFGWLDQRSLQRVLVKTLLAGAVALALLVPWGLRNQQAFGHFSLTSFNGGVNLWMGNNPETNGGYMPPPDEFADTPIAEVNAELQKRAIQFIAQNPGKYVYLSVRRLVGSLSTDTIAAVWNEPGIARTFGGRAVTAFKALCSLVHWAILVGVVWRFVRLRRAGLGVADAKLACAFVLLAIPFVLIVGGNRYMLPVVPVLCAWFGAALSLLIPARVQAAPAASRKPTSAAQPTPPPP